MLQSMGSQKVGHDLATEKQHIGFQIMSVIQQISTVPSACNISSSLEQVTSREDGGPGAHKAERDSCHRDAGFTIVSI